MVRGACSPAGVAEPGIAAIGVSQERGRSCRHHRLIRRSRSRRATDSRSTAIALLGGGSEAQDAPCGIAKRRQPSAARETAGSRSALIVPSKRGNGTTRTAGREARRLIVEPLEGKTAHASKCEPRVNETTAVSNAGATVAADGIHFPGAPDGQRLASRGVSAYSQRRCRGR